MAVDPAGAPGAPLRAPLRLILGLGNPGERYAETRHNLGFRVVEELARRRGLKLVDGACGSRMAERPGLILAAPQTFMNRSGYAARCFAEHRGVAPADMLVVYDDVALPLGKLRLRPSGSPGGHRGMESILENLGTADVPRLRLGVGPEDATLPVRLEEWVLRPFPDSELASVDAMIQRAADAVEMWLEVDLSSVMNRYNG
ncbi:MAG: aminoacyl-tRNA hydrolase [Acidobacteriota bacterium]